MFKRFFHVLRLEYLLPLVEIIFTLMYYQQRHQPNCSNVLLHLAVLISFFLYQRSCLNTTIFCESPCRTRAYPSNSKGSYIYDVRKNIQKFRPPIPFVHKHPKGYAPMFCFLDVCNPSTFR